MPTRAGWLLAVGSLAACATGRAFGTVELYVLGATGLVALAAAVASVRRRRPPLVIDRRVVPDRVTVGSAARVELEVQAADRRVPPLTLVDPVSTTVGARLSAGPLGPGERTSVGYRLPTARRGVLELGPLQAEVGDPYGLARRRLADGDRSRVTVLPAIEVVAPVPVGARGRAEGTGSGRRSAAPTPNDDLVSLRPYVVGDDLRRVHWPTSARTDDLVVRRDEHDRPGRTTLVLDVATGAMGPAAFERAVSAAASLVHAASEAGDVVRLVAGSDLDSGMVDARRAATALLEQLAVVAQVDEPSIPTLDPQATDAVVVVTGERPSALLGTEVDVLAEVRFSDGEAAVPERRQVVAVGADEPFGQVWAGWLASRAPTEAAR